MTRRQETLSVGILSAPEISFVLLLPGQAAGASWTGRHIACVMDGRILFEGSLYDELRFHFEPCGGDEAFSPASFRLENVVIGKAFHWQRKEDQCFAGDLKLIVEDGQLTAVNLVGLEDYLRSVISSEMKSTASLEFLKAHAVISRSWLLAQIEKAAKVSAAEVLPEPVAEVKDGVATLIRWFDREDHKLYDVCADDHCQRYQGLSRVVTEKADAVIDATWGEVLMDGTEICDARFSKCCGGVTELFSSCWEDRDMSYLPSRADTPGEDPAGHPFCDTSDRAILEQVLNDYDLETQDFFRWKVTYTREALDELVRRRSGVDFGHIVDMIPVRRGPSGRIIVLEIRGTKQSMRVGKELMIRKWLSESHLKSSAFDVEFTDNEVILTGSGWGHGVGLCQIGAAVMGASGYSYREILEHYFPGAALVRRYH